MTRTAGDAADLDQPALLAQVQELRDTLDSIRQGVIDAVITGRPGEEQVYTLTSADRPYRLIVQEMDEGAITVSQRGVVLYANPRVAELLGRDVGELVGGPVSALVAEEDRPALATLLTLGAQEHGRAEIALAGADGPVPALVSASCLDIEGTTVVCLIVTDLTAQKRVESTLRQSERRLQQFLDAVPVGLFVAEPGGRIAFVNSTGRRLLGGDAVPALQQIPVPGLVYESGTDRPYPPSRLPLARALKGQEVHLDDLVLRPPGRAATPVEAWATPVRGSEGDIEYALAALADISERRRAEQVMAEQAAMLDLAHDAVIVWDAESRVTYWNRGAQQTYGYTRRQALGANVHDLLRTEFHEPVEAITAKVERHGQWDGEVVQRACDGRRLVVATRWAYHWGLDGRLLGTMEINRDVTARRDAEAELARRAEEIAAANDELRRSNLDLEQFAYAASHDLSEPLRAISLPVSMLARRYQGRLDEQADQYIAFAVDGCRQMQSLIEDLLLYSRVGRVEAAMQPVDLGALVRDVLAVLAPVVTEADADVTVGVLPVVTGEPTQLRQVFQNLLTNAVKFAAPGRRPDVRVAAARSDGEWRIEVTDNGIGIDPRHRERVFGMFKRLHTREDYPGTGIGLAITQKVVERHRGRIGVDDTPAGVGCRFWFTLPA